jgi:hypothetical protein
MLSAPFAARELNGEMLLEEVATLRGRGVPQSALEYCAASLARSAGAGAAQVPDTVQQIASSGGRCPSPLAHLVAAWARKVRTDDDAVALADHFSRVARVAALLPALVQASERGGGRA